MEEQLNFPFDEPFAVSDTPELWAPREIWVRFAQRMIPYFNEDRRLEYKATPKLHWDDLAAYYSAFSNSPDGGVLCIGVKDDGSCIGCKNLSPEQLNRVETFHIQNCPAAKPEVKRVPIALDEKQDFLILIYIPYCGKLVETNKGDAWIRMGDTKRKMSEEEKRDYRSTRNETSFELEDTNYRYPEDFRTGIIQDFAISSAKEKLDRIGRTKKFSLTGTF